jgi:hypothetical protein
LACLIAQISFGMNPLVFNDTIRYYVSRIIDRQTISCR